MSSPVSKAYSESEVEVMGAYQRFLYGFGAQLGVLGTLLAKQHWQAAADIMPHVELEKAAFETVLLEAAQRLSDKSVAADRVKTADADAHQHTEEPSEPGSIHGEAPNFGEEAS